MRRDSVNGLDVSRGAYRYIEFRQSIAAIAAFMQAALEERRHDSAPKSDLLNMFLTHRLEDEKHRFSEAQLSHEMSAIVFAGHETTATAFAWVFCLLAQHPTVLERLLSEVDATSRSTRRVLTISARCRTSIR